MNGPVSQLTAVLLLALPISNISESSEGSWLGSPAYPAEAVAVPASVLPA